MAREISEGDVILPIWHGVSVQDVVAFSPTLADTLAFVTADIDGTTLALQILRRVNLDLYRSHSRDDLEQIAGEDIVDALQDEIEEVQYQLGQTREELSEFQCPTCKSKLEISTIVPCEPHEYDSDFRFDRYECGYETTDGWMSRPCPYHLKFPNPEDYELVVSGKAGSGFICWAKGLTDMASLVNVGLGQGETAEAAEADIRRRLPRRRQLPNQN